MNDAQTFLAEYKTQNEQCHFKNTNADDYTEELGKIHDGTYIKPISTGIRRLDPHFNLFLGMLCLITGYSQSGKSELIKFITANWVLNGNGKVCIFSPESDTPILINEYIHACMNHLGQGWAESRNLFNEYFTILEISDEIGMPDINFIIEEMSNARKSGYNFFVIDPLNWLTTTQYNANAFEAIRLTLTYLKQFAKRNSEGGKSVVCYVEHPKTPQPNKDGIYPKASIFSVNMGVMHNNKVDGALIIHREKKTNVFETDSMSEQDAVLIEVAKLKMQKYLGRPDTIEVSFNPETGEYV